MYRYDFDGFCEIFIDPISIKKERTTTIQGVHASLVGTLNHSLVLATNGHLDWSGIQRKQGRLGMSTIGKTTSAMAKAVGPFKGLGKSMASSKTYWAY